MVCRLVGVGGVEQLSVTKPSFPRVIALDVPTAVSRTPSPPRLLEVRAPSQKTTCAF